MGCHHHALLLDKNAVKLAKMSGIDFLLMVKLLLDLKQKSIHEKALNDQILITRKCLGPLMLLCQNSCSNYDSNTIIIIIILH